MLSIKQALIANQSGSEHIISYELVTTSRFINPQFINAIQSGNHGVSVVQQDGSISVCGTQLIFAGCSKTLSPGTQVKIHISNRNFYCQSVEDIECYTQKIAALEQVENAKKSAERAKDREEAIAFNVSLQIPVRWIPGTNIVLSGLSAKSDGTGRNRATVQHVYLLDNLNVGKLKRNAEDFLCGNSSSNFRARYFEAEGFTGFGAIGGGIGNAGVVDIVGDAGDVGNAGDAGNAGNAGGIGDGDSNLYAGIPKVTCKACLAIAERIRRRTGNKVHL